MLPADTVAAAFSNDHLDIDVGGFGKRLAIMDALASLIRQEREAVREACVKVATDHAWSRPNNRHFENGGEMNSLAIADALRELPVD